MPQAQRVLLVDDSGRDSLLPLALTRPIAHFRLGVDTLLDKWTRAFAGLHAAEESPVNPLPALSRSATSVPSILPHVPGHALPEWRQTPQPDDLFVLSRLLPDASLAAALQQLQPGQVLVQDGQWLGARAGVALEADALPRIADFAETVAYAEPVSVLRHLWELVEWNPACIAVDVQALTAGRQSQPLDASVTVLGAHTVFLEPGAVVVASVLDAREGPLYFGAASEVMPGCLLRGPFALGEHAVLKMGAKIYGGTSIGPGCRAGGEISQSLLMANSNKGHDGFLGHSVLGEWCNLGADTNTSNLKNDYGTVKLYNAASGQYENTGRQFCGLFMGDHSKAGINTMFNTGTVVGVCANIFGGGFPPKFLPSFSWGGAEDLSTYRPEKALETARRVMARRQQALSAEQEKTLNRIFEQTRRERFWDNP
ncbi:MAG: glucose-1-phosphate thymidylyltransferase [Bacteroidetes bacterium]|nr:glucose-1-phosphate thymidylyltransferase [Bacteroidota bacterium]